MTIRTLAPQVDLKDHGSVLTDALKDFDALAQGQEAAELDFFTGEEHSDELPFDESGW